MQDGIELLKHTLLLTLKKSKNKTRSIHTPLHPTHTHQQGDDVQDGVELLERLAELALRHRAIRALQLLLQLRQRVHLQGEKRKETVGLGVPIEGRGGTSVLQLLLQLRQGVHLEKKNEENELVCLLAFFSVCVCVCARKRARPGISLQLLLQLH